MSGELWDVFHSDQLEVERGLALDAIVERIRAGTVNLDDLIRPFGSTRWTRIGDRPDLANLEPPPAPEPEPEPEPAGFAPIDDEDDDAIEVEPISEFPTLELDDEEETPPPPIRRAAPVLPDDEAGATGPPELDDPLPAELESIHDAQDDEAAEFTLSRNRPETVEELDLAAMVDVAFQLVLFFLVTASTVVFKTIEVPKPNEDRPPEAAAQSRQRSVEDLEKDYILVEVDAEGSVKVDHQPVEPLRPALLERLRSARESTGRKAMLLSADFATRHRSAVLAFDVASEIGLEIAIAQPAAVAGGNVVAPAPASTPAPAPNPATSKGPGRR